MLFTRYYIYQRAFNSTLVCIFFFKFLLNFLPVLFQVKCAINTGNYHHYYCISFEWCEEVALKLEKSFSRCWIEKIVGRKTILFFLYN